MMRTLTTDRLTLRRPEAGDWPALRDVFMSDRGAYIGGPYDAAGAWMLFAAELGHWQMYDAGLWAVTDTADGTYYGIVGPWHPEHWPEKEIGWVLTEAAQGKSIGYEAALAARADCFDRLGWDTAVSYIHPDNTRSIALAERLGAVLEPAAVHPKPDQPCLVYRHPKGGA